MLLDNAKKRETTRGMKGKKEFSRGNWPSKDMTERILSRALVDDIQQPIDDKKFEQSGLSHRRTSEKRLKSAHNSSITRDDDNCASRRSDGAPRTATASSDAALTVGSKISKLRFVSSTDLPFKDFRANCFAGGGAAEQGGQSH